MRRLPKPPLATLGSDRRIDVEVVGYDDVWLPSVGYGEAVQLRDDDTSTRAGDLRYNPSAGTAVLTSGIGEGARFSLDARVQVEPETDELLDTPVANLAMPAVENLPDVVAAKADEYVGDATSPIEQLRAIETALKTNGFLSHGLASDTVPSRAGHGADRIIELFTRTQMVGDEEQYASAMALMARHLGYPARVVMGFAPEVGEGDDTVEVVGADVSAWVEVPFDGVGWVSFRPTPDQVDVPQEQTPKPKSEPQPQVRQPPRAEHDEEQLLTSVEIDDSDDDRDQPFAIPGWVWVTAAAVGIPAIIVFLPMLVVALVKGARRRRRRSGANDRRSAGAWEELVDRYAELGFEPPAQGTRLQSARALERQLAEQGLAGRPSAAGHASTAPPSPVRLSTLAMTIDRDVFGGAPVSDAVVEERWSVVDAATGAVARAAGRVRRFISRYRVRSRR